jgi:hypothetical protein
MAGKAELRGRRGDLALAVRLHDAAGDERVSPAPYCLVQHVVELAQLVAAEAEPGTVLALDPEPRPAEMRGQALQRLERRRQMGETEAGKAREADLQVVDRGVMHGGDDSSPARPGNASNAHSTSLRIARPLSARGKPP